METFTEEGSARGMLVIRSGQMEVLAAANKSQFIDRLLPHLAADYPSWYAAHQDSGARSFVEKVIGIGEEHNIFGKGSVSALVDLMVEFGEMFEKSPDRDWAIKLLSHPSLPDHTKVPLLSERLRQRTGGRRIVEIEAADA